MKKILLSIFIILILVLGGVIFYAYQQLTSPYGLGGKVQFPAGTSIQQMGEKLAQADIIASPLAFKLYIRWKKWDKQLQAGEYEFSPQQTLPQVVDKIRRGERVIYRLNFPEGVTYVEISKRLVEANLATAAEMQAAFRDPKYLNQLNIGATSLEGYLFPSTYEYDSMTTLDQMLTKMIKTFQQQWDESMKARLSEMAWTLPQIITLASLIEKETGQVSERKLIASVFHNRLTEGMLLQSDPTIIYGLQNFDGNIRKGDILNPHLYNTYVHPGLPPGPIASPGKAAILAALYPEISDYLFFVSKGDGSHYFSKNLDEHNEAVSRYQLNSKN